MNNQAFLSFDLCNRRRTIETNTVRLHLLDVEFEKHGPRCNHVVEGDIVKYRITLRNKSDVELRDVMFRDPLAHETEYVRGSFCVDGRHERPIVHRNEISFRFERLRPHARHEISFEVRIGRRHHEEDCRPGRPCRPERPEHEEEEGRPERPGWPEGPQRPRGIEIEIG